MSHSNPSRQVIIATDGGCSPNPGQGAYAAIMQFWVDDELKDEAEVAEAFAETTNNRMEVQAALAALESLKRACTVLILSDSEYLVVNARDRLAKWIATGKLNKKKNVDLWQGLWQQLERHTVTFEHVTGHSGHDLNERAHQLVTKTRLAFSNDPYWCDWCNERPAAAGIPCTVCVDLGANEADGPPDANQTIGLSAVATDEALVAEDQQAVYRLLIAGSRNATAKQLDYAQCLVKRCQEFGYQIVVGDNPQGVDRKVVVTCNDIGYNNVIVVGTQANPRNGGVEGGRYEQQGQSYRDRDCQMVKASHRGIFLVNMTAESPGTEAGYAYMKSLPKKIAHCIEFKD